MAAAEQLVLIGLRGAGKTTVGRQLAARLGCPFRDGDEAIAARVSEPAGEWLARVGEAAFRAVEEEETLLLLAAPGPAVLALGGGAILSPRVRRALAGPRVATVFLDAPIDVLAARIAADPAVRPPLQGLPPDRELSELDRQRRPLYEQVALWTAPAGAGEEVVDWILARWGAR